MILAGLAVWTVPALCASSVPSGQKERRAAFHFFPVAQYERAQSCLLLHRHGVIVLSLSFSHTKRLAHPDFIADCDLGSFRTSFLVRVVLAFFLLNGNSDRNMIIFPTVFRGRQNIQFCPHRSTSQEFKRGFTSCRMSCCSVVV